MGEKEGATDEEATLPMPPAEEATPPMPPAEDAAPWPPAEATSDASKAEGGLSFLSWWKEHCSRVVFWSVPSVMSLQGGR